MAKKKESVLKKYSLDSPKPALVPVGLTRLEAVELLHNHLARLAAVHEVLGRFEGTGFDWTRRSYCVARIRDLVSSGLIFEEDITHAIGCVEEAWPSSHWTAATVLLDLDFVRT